MGRGTIGDQRHLISFPSDAGLPDGGQNLPFGHLILESVKFLILDEADGIIAPDRALEQTLGVIRESRRNHREGRHIGIPVFRGMRVGRPHLQTGTRRATEHDRN